MRRTVCSARLCRGTRSRRRYRAAGWSTSAATTRCRATGAMSTARPSPVAPPGSTTGFPSTSRTAWNFPEGDLSSDQRHRVAPVAHLHPVVRRGAHAEHDPDDGERGAVGRRRPRSHGQPARAASTRGRTSPTPATSSLRLATTVSLLLYRARCLSHQGQRRTDLGVIYVYRVPGGRPRATVRRRRRCSICSISSSCAVR